jgi:hypothetical protein
MVGMYRSLAAVVYFSNFGTINTWKTKKDLQ